MLDTLNSYIDRSDERFVWGDWPQDEPSKVGGSLNRFFPVIVTVSVIGHVIFYAALVMLDAWTTAPAKARRVRSQEVGETVKMIDVAAPLDKRFGVRPKPEQAERADLEHLSLDPRLGDDTTLISRSPNPVRSRVAGDRPDAAPGRPGSTHASASASTATAAQTRSREFPATRPPQINPAATQTQPVAPAAVPLPQPSPPPQPARPSPKPGPDLSKESASRAKGEGAPTPSELAFRSAQSQYVAIVRDRIWKVNERIMPRDWVRDMLSDKVSADFTILLGRGGQLLSSKMIRSSGYSTLDEKAREAIHLAAPFQGYPQEAGDRIEFTVTVYYTPTR